MAFNGHLSHPTLELLQPVHECIVDRAEGAGGLVGVFADLIGELHEPVEAGVVLDLAAQLVDKGRQIIGDLLDVFQ